MKRKIGIHLSISGGVHTALIRAQKLQVNAVQIFLKNSNQWKAKPYSENEISLFQEERKISCNMYLVAHTGYLINLAGEGGNLIKSIEAMEDECRRAVALGLEHLVLHPGSHLGKGIEHGRKRTAESLDTVFSRLGNKQITVLLETTAGQGTSIGHTFEDLQGIIENSDSRDNIGICLDTCHLFAAGYDISCKKSYESVIGNCLSIFGRDRLKLIHLNDSKRECGSRVDRHEHIGDGMIGIAGFRYLLNDERLKHVPVILETPNFNDFEADVMNLNRVRKLIKK